MNILIVNAYSWYNKGDAAIVLSMVDSLKKYLPEADITVVTSTPQVDVLKYEKYGFQTVGDILNTISLYELTGTQTYQNESNFSQRIGTYGKLVKIRTMYGAISAVKLLFSAWVLTHLRIRLGRLLNKNETRFLERYVNADIVISCGGGFLNDYSVRSLINNLVKISLSTVLRKPTVIYGQSIGPFQRRLWAIITAQVLKRVDMILIREEISRELLKNLGVDKPRVFLTADAAFTLCPVDKKSVLKLMLREKIDPEDRPLVGITVRKWFFPKSNRPLDEYENYLYTIGRVIDYIVDRMDATIILLPQVTVHPNDDDRFAATKLCQLVKHPEHVRNLVTDFSPQEIKGIIGELDLFIGTRMHSNIFALAMRVPTVAISYEHKTEGIMSMLGLQRYVIPIDKLRFEDIIAKVDDAWENREKLREDLLPKIKKMQANALLNARLVKEFVLANAKALTRANPDIRYINTITKHKPLRPSRKTRMVK